MSVPQQSPPRKPKGRAPSVTAAGFLVAFVLSTATIIYTGLKVGAPRQDRSAAPPMESRLDDAAAVAGAAGAAGAEEKQEEQARERRPEARAGDGADDERSGGAERPQQAQ